MRSPSPTRNELRIGSLYVLWRQDFIVSKACASWKLAPTRENLHPHGMGKLAATSLCGDKISSCRRSASWKLAPTWENSHPQFKNTGSEPVEDQMPVCLVATRFHLVGEVQVENSHPHGKTRTHVSCGDEISIVSGKCKLETRTHMGKLAPTWDGKTYSHLSLVATRFHLVEGMCKLKTRTHMGKTRIHMGKTCSTLWRWYPAGTVPES